jgi:hypothetical protein
MEQLNNPGGAPAPPAGPAGPEAPAIDPAAILVELVQAMTTLADASTKSLANSLSKAKVVQKPSPFKGDQESDARRFLAAYQMWARAQGTALNTVNQEGRATDPDQTEWIRVALSYLQDDAAIWAAPAMEEFANGGVPFYGQWGVFCTEFKARFETVDETVDAKEKLRKLEQGTSTVPEYAALFKQLMARTGYSSADLRDRFYDRLDGKIKDELVHTARPTTSLHELIAVASDLDIRIRQREAERNRERGRSGAYTGTRVARPTVPTVSYNPFIPPATEPVAMDVDATRTREEFARQMKGRCYGCGSSTHTIKDGRHERDLCGHCKRTGHREVVCMEKFLGRNRGQKAAATTEDNNSEPDFPDLDTEEEERAMIQATKIASTKTALAELKEQQKVLAEKIAALEEDF